MKTFKSQVYIKEVEEVKHFTAMWTINVKKIGPNVAPAQN